MYFFIHKFLLLQVDLDIRPHIDLKKKIGQEDLECNLLNIAQFFCSIYFSATPALILIKVKTRISSVETLKTCRVEEWGLQALPLLPLDHRVLWVTPLGHQCPRAPQDNTLPIDFQCRHQCPLVRPQPSMETNPASALR